MPLGFLIIGAIVLVAALRNTHRQLGALVAGDFTGAGNFWYWIAALALIGGLGYIPAFQGPSRALLALIILVLLLTNGQGFFSQLTAALASAPGLTQTNTASKTGAPAGEPAAPSPPQINVTVAGLGGGSSGGSSAASFIGPAASIIGAIA